MCESFLPRYISNNNFMYIAMNETNYEKIRVNRVKYQSYG